MNYIKKNKRVFYLTFIISMVSSCAVLLQAYLMGEIVDHAGEEFKAVIRMFLIIVITLVVEILCNAGHSYFSANYLDKVIKSLYAKINSKIIYSSLQDLNLKDNGEILSVTNNFMGEIKAYYLFLLGIGYIPLKLTVPLIMMFSVSWKVAVSILIATPLCLLPGMLIGNKQYRLNRESADHSNRLNGYFHHMMNFLKIIKAYTLEEKYEEKNEAYLHSYFRSKNKLNQSITILTVLNHIAGLFPFLTLYLLGAFFALNGELSIGELIAISFYINILTEAIDQLQSYTEKKKKYLSGYHRIQDILNLQDNITEGLYLQKGNTDIILQFQNVHFQYAEGQKVLENVSFEISKGSKLLVLGASGKGKTTLIRLIAGLYRPNIGEISAYTDVYSDVGKLLSISIAAQESILFTKSIKDNIKMVNPFISEKEYHKICKLVEIEDLICDGNSQNKTVADIGSNLSKGQMQRIALARALAKEADLYIFDEPISGLNHWMQNRVTTNIMNYLKDKTVIVISHTTELYSLFDKIYTVNNRTVFIQNSSDFTQEAKLCEAD